MTPARFALKLISLAVIASLEPARMPTVPSVAERFQLALDRLLDRARKEPAILAVVLAGSMSHDTVWEKSDMDLMIILRDEQTSAWAKKSSYKSMALTENSVNIHTSLLTRSAFKKLIEGSLQSSFMHSLISKSKLVYCRDETIREWYDGISRLGTKDREIQLLTAASWLTAIHYKAQKWLMVRNDPHYAAYWVMHCITPLAQIEVYLEGHIASREVIAQAQAINPEFFDLVYTRFLDAKKTRQSVLRVLNAIDDYLLRKHRMLFGPLLDYLAQLDSPRSATDIDNHFTRTHNMNNTIMACEWLADKNIILQLSLPAKLTEKCHTDFEEMAFIYDRSPK